MKLRVAPQAFRIAAKNAFALSFQVPIPNAQPLFTEHETLLRPVPGFTVRTWLPLTEAVNQNEIDKRHCGVLYIEYATAGKQGIHVLRL